MLNYNNLPMKRYKRRNAEIWLSLVRKCEESGQSMKEFCEAHQINPISLKNWKYRFKKKQQEAVVVNNVTGFAPVRIGNELDSIGGSAIKVELRSNVKIIVPNNFDDRQLLRLVNLLQ